jgi:ATP-dependent Lon protease
MITRNKKRQFPDLYKINTHKRFKLNDSDSGTELESDSELSNESETELSNESETELSNESETELSNESETEESETEETGELDDNIHELHKEVFKKFDEYLYSIVNGKFFEIYKTNYTIKNLKKDFDINTIDKYNHIFELIRNEYILKGVGIIEILEKNISIDIKKKLLEKLYHIANSEILSNEYNEHIKELKELLNSKESEELTELENKITNTIDKDECGIISKSYKHRILNSMMNFNNKVIAYKYMKIMESYGTNSSSEEHIKYKTWLNTLLTIPFNKYYNININYNDLNDIKHYISNIRESLDKDLSFLEKPKDQIINIISQLIRNPQSNINAIGLYGNKGLGKTHFVECVANALNRPLVRISLGGNSDATILKGHNFTYIGSKQGKIIDALIESKIMNPIFFFDEIDKISNTDHGRDISGTLIHLIDLTTNNKYNGDEYFSGIEIDLSRALFIFTYNDPNMIDPILADRIYKIQIENYNVKEKIEITQKHLINNVLKGFNFNNNEIKFEEDAINYIVETSKNNEGMRNIKSKIQTIISRINTLLLTDSSKNIVNLKYKDLYNYYNSFPIYIKKDHIDILLEDSIDKENINEFKHLLMYI